MFFRLGLAVSTIAMSVLAQQTALDHFEKYLRLSPLGRYASHLAGIGGALFFLCRFDEAAATLRRALEEVPGHIMACRLLAGCYAHLGRFAEAHQIIDRLRAITSVVVPNYTPYRNAEHRELFLSGLRLAAGEET